MRFGKQILAIAVISACGSLFCNGLFNAFASDDAVIADADKVYAMSHRYKNLPGWSQDGKAFHPTILMAYIKSSVDTTGWGKMSTMAPYEANSCLVICTTSRNHSAIRDLLEQLRSDAINPITE